MTEGIYAASYVSVSGARAEVVDGGVIEEAMVCISLNGRELATFMCSPVELEDLALGFLRSEGLIARLDDVDLITVSRGNTCVDVWLRDRSVEPPTRAIVTSGCGGGITFDDLSGRHVPLNGAVSVAPHQITRLMHDLMRAGELYNEVRGVHTSALSDGRRLLLVAQDVGRHNTVDRLWGKALRTGVATDERILLASGRISSEMLNKAAKMGVPLIISRTSPTSLSVELARAWNITVVGYARGNQCRIYSAPERVNLHGE